MANEKPIDVIGNSFDHFVLMAVCSLREMVLRGEAGKDILKDLADKHLVSKTWTLTDAVNMVDDYIADNVFRYILETPELEASLAYHVKERYITKVRDLVASEGAETREEAAL